MIQLAFFVESAFGGARVFRTVDYGESWEMIGAQGVENFLDMYCLNKFTVYLVSNGYSGVNNFTIDRFINGNTRTVYNSEILSTGTTLFNQDDTIKGNPLCEEMEDISFYIEKNGVNIEFHIDFTEVISNIVEYNQKEVFDLCVFPNPASDLIFLKDEKLMKLQKHFEILSISGQIMITGFTMKPWIDISMLDTGIYFLNIYEGKHCFSVKFVKN